LRLKPAGLSPLKVGVALAGEDARRAERDTLIRCVPVSARTGTSE
jgi:hypothetical protein